MKYIAIVSCVLLSLTFTLAEEGADKSDIEKNLLRENAEIKERLSRQLKWFEPSKAIFSKNKSDIKKEDVGRVFNLGLGGSKSFSQLDLLIDTVNRALFDLSRICEAISDKFERFVHEDEANMLTIQVGSRRLFDMLQDFQLRATTLAQQSVSTSFALANANRGLLGGVLGGLGR